MEHDRANYRVQNGWSDLQMNAVERARAEAEMRRAMALAEWVHAGWSYMTGKLRRIRGGSSTAQRARLSTADRKAN